MGGTSHSPGLAAAAAAAAAAEPPDPAAELAAALLAAAAAAAELLSPAPAVCSNNTEFSSGYCGLLVK